MCLEREAAQWLEQKNMGASSHPLACSEEGTLISRQEALSKVQRTKIGSGSWTG